MLLSTASLLMHGQYCNKKPLNKYAVGRQITRKLELPAVNTIRDKKALEPASEDHTATWELISLEVTQSDLFMHKQNLF